ncbi:hypothetical protein C7451_10647 [Blastomonas natatoria]|uniref:DNA-binding MarR family transcriptional regulator n=1 Tax=Blastomonas natatoria TaxID=34015 RepID=A0A2V3V272_9SPHN|nr:MarR family winged helix-turn-helix transcriptional regulator [Blastomonas natatoria]PXW75886.1 hypothetical protein C7451_10647 [Blastomonas natatoria]
MSEDTGSRLDQWLAPHGDALPIHADTSDTAALVSAAGWDVSAEGFDHIGRAAIMVLDWRDGVPAGIPIDRLAQDCGLLVLVELDAVDQADATLAGREVRLVVGANPALIATELHDLVVHLRTRQASDSSRDERARLAALARELAQLAERLGTISDEQNSGSGQGLADHGLDYHAEPAADLRRAKPPAARLIRQLIAMRRMRDRFFSSELFADPAWDILLDLTASRLERKSVAVSSLCIAAAVPPTTALRWIRMMTDQGLLERRADTKDARRMFIDLSDVAFRNVCGWFALVEARGGMAG